MEKFAGADWLIANRIAQEETISELGRKVADLLGDLNRGIYHLNPKSLRKVDWTNPDWIGVTVVDGLATWDYNDLTHLVVLCHDRMLRCQIDGLGPGYLRLCFHRRESREGRVSQRHPTIMEAIETIRVQYR